MKCIECGKGRMQRHKARTPHEVRGVKFEVEGIALVCARCGFQTIPADLLNEHGRLVDQGYRKAAGLLGTAEIRAYRVRLKMNQQKFAEYLGVGEASVKRWELGALQEKSSDDLIRLKTDPAYARKNLDELCRLLGQAPPSEQREVVFVAGSAGFTRVQRSWDTTIAPFANDAALSVSEETWCLN